MKTKTPIEIINIVEQNGELLTTEQAVECCERYHNQFSPVPMTRQELSDWYMKLRFKQEPGINISNTILNEFQFYLLSNQELVVKESLPEQEEPMEGDVKTVCSNCKGSGRVSYGNNFPQHCSQCDGTGIIFPSPTGTVTEPCPLCSEPTKKEPMTTDEEFKQKAINKLMEYYDFGDKAGYSNQELSRIQSCIEHIRSVI
jgi:hypothetical protein